MAVIDSSIANAAAIQHGHIDDTQVPGTVLIVDIDHRLHSKHAQGHQDIVLVPTPSTDPNDPLNWSPQRKYLSIACMCVYVWFVGIASSVVYSVETPLAAALGISVSDINAGTGYMFLLAGWGLLLWQPFALQYGKRPTYLISVAANLAITMWGPYARGNGAWIGRSVMAGLFCAPIEALPEISVSDVFFAHERNTFMGVYAFVLAGSNFFAPIICGWINIRLGYKWVFYIPAIMLACAFVFLFLFMEETNYDRQTIGVVEYTTTTTSSPISESPSPSPITPKSKSLLNRLSLFDKPRPQRMPYRLTLSFRLISWPVVFYAGFSYGSYLIWFNVLNGTSSLILGGAPYDFSTGLVGTSYVACMVGVASASLFTGYMTDRFALRMARRNGGVMEPEHKLWLFALPTVVVVASLLLWGVGAAHGVNWFGLIVAMCGTAFANTCGITLSVTYMIDSYREIAGDAITSIIIIRNTMSFAIAYGITPWIDGMGYQNCFVTAAFVALAAALVFVWMIFKGKGYREAYRVKYWDLVRKHIDMGMVH